ncbi:MAG: hypothetical protein J0M02_05295 [Planctomycetes bacterium]|nr:hypothetical protein [Planctomycetota bacterium]
MTRRSRWIIAMAIAGLAVALLAYPAWRLARRHVIRNELQAAWERSKAALPASAARQEPLAEASCIAHAGGAVDGITYLNIMEGWQRSVEAGATLIEADMLFTSDGVLVLAHDWDHFHRLTGEGTGVVTTAQFKASRLLGRFAPATWADAQEFLLKHPTVRVVTDTKESAPRLLKQLADAPCKLQIIPQIYHPDEIAPAIAGGWKQIIFSAYKHPYPTAMLLDIAKTTGCALTMPLSRLDQATYDAARTAGVRLLVHPVDSPAEVSRFPGIGVYTSHVGLFLGAHRRDP